LSVGTYTNGNATNIQQKTTTYNTRQQTHNATQQNTAQNE